MRSRLPLASLAVLVAQLVVQSGCRQPPAELQLPDHDDVRAEPSGLGGPQVVVEAPSSRPSDAGPLLDWTSVDDRHAALIDGYRARVEYDVDHPWAGASAPLVTVVVFHDYQCPYSKRLDADLRQLLAQHPDDVRVVWRQLPLGFHREAELAARFALAANQQGVFGPVHDWLFANAKTLNRPDIEQAAAGFGLDLQRLRADVDGDWIASRVQADVELAKAIGVTSTPTFFVNGKPVRGSVPLDQIEAKIQEELALANQLVAAGSDRREVWARILAASQPGVVAFDSPKRGPDANKRYVVDVTGLPTRGAAKPKVTILMCGDFDCPYCARSTAVLEQLLKNHPKDLALVFRHMPLDFHPTAMAAHRAAVAAANQGEFWPMFDLLLANQSLRTDAELEDLAKRAKLDLKQYRRDIADAQTDATIQQHEDICAKQLDVRGTPSFFINGRSLSGAQPIDDFEAMIAEELAASAKP